MDDLHSARAEAEAGIARCDKRIGEALRPDSPLAPYLTLYVQQRRAYALTAAHHTARMERRCNIQSHKPALTPSFRSLQVGFLLLMSITLLWLWLNRSWKRACAAFTVVRRLY